MPRCAIGLGGNIGHVAGAFLRALRSLAESHCSVIESSRLYVTSAVGPQAGDHFENACALLDTELPPHDLLDLLQRLERDAGRTPSVRWGSRLLDIDLLTYGDLVLNDPRLTIPHPGLVYRRFVVDPLAEIAPELVHPVLGLSISELQQRLLARPLRIELWAGSDAVRASIRARLRDHFTDLVRFESAVVSDRDAGQFLIDLDPRGPLDQRPPMERLVAQADPILLEDDSVAAAVAVVTAMLDEPHVPPILD